MPLIWNLPPTSTGTRIVTSKPLLVTGRSMVSLFLPEILTLMKLTRFYLNFYTKIILKIQNCSIPNLHYLFITNSTGSFQNTTTLPIGLSNVHKMKLIVLKAIFQKVFFLENLKTLN